MRTILRNPVLVAVLAAATALAGCTAEAPGTDAPAADVEAEVRARVQEFAAAQRELDADRVLAFLTDDFAMIQDGVRATRSETVAMIRSGLPTFESLETRFEDVRILVIGPTAALTSMTFRDRVTAADGTVTTSRGPSTLLWRRVDDQWLIAFADSDHYPDEAPESE